MLHSASVSAHDAFTTASISAVMQDLTAADRHNPPHNGREVLSRTEQALTVLDLFEFTLREFCEPSAEQDTSRVAALRAKRQAEATAGSTVKPKREAKEATDSRESKVPSRASPDLEVAALMASMRTVPAYAPRAMSATDNTLDHYSSMTTIRYIDPITDKVESTKLAAKRAMAQRILEKTFLQHHPSVTTSCRHGDIAAMWSIARALCVGDDTHERLDTISDMVDMVRNPPATWPALSHMLTKLQLRINRNSTAGDGLTIGHRLLPEFTLRALQHPQFSYLRVDIALLHKVSTELTLKRIQQDLTAAHSVAPARTGGRAYAAETTHPPSHGLQAATDAGGDKQVCFHFRDHGKCRFGDKCRFIHDSGQAGSDSRPLTGSCLACGSKAHGIKQCPQHKKQQREAGSKRAEAKAAEARMAQLTTEVASLTAMMASAHSNSPAIRSSTDAAASGPALERQVQHLQAQLAAAHANDPFRQSAGGMPQ
jgi:hypothetical protein